MQPSGRVDQEQIVAIALGSLHGLIGQPRGIGTAFLGDHRAAGALAPNLELLDGRGAEGVTGGQGDGLSVAAKSGRQFADGRRLAAAVDPDDQHHMGLVFRVEFQGLGDRFQNFGNVLGEGPAHFLGTDFLVKAGFGQPLRQLGRGRDSQVRSNQQLFELFERLLVQLALCEDGPRCRRPVCEEERDRPAFSRANQPGFLACSSLMRYLYGNQSRHSAGSAAEMRNHSPRDD